MISLHDLGHHLPCPPWDLWAPFQYILGPQKSNLPASPGTLCAPTPLQVTDNTSCLNDSQLGKVSPGSIRVYFQEYELAFSGRRKVLDISTFPRKGPGNMFVTSKGVSSESLGHKPASLSGKYFWKVSFPQHSLSVHPHETTKSIPSRALAELHFPAPVPHQP